MNIEVNFLAVVVAGVVSMALGFLWYSPMVLGKQWIKEKGLNQEKLKAEQKKMGPLYGLSFLIALITAYVLSHIMALSRNFYGYDPIPTGLITAFWVWLGFVMPVQTTATIFGDKNWKLLGIDTGYQSASLLSMGLIIGFLG